MRVLLFESVRELLFNTVKYARADRVTLTCRVDDDGRLQIAVADDGRGFDQRSFSNQDAVLADSVSSASVNG